MKSRSRLDVWLAERGQVQSRSRARDLIARGQILINGQPARKASYRVQENDDIHIIAGANHYVSRAALKLEAALQASGLCPKDKICLDLGTSTGGFCQVLLEKGAAHIHAVEVGHGQLHSRLAHHPRLTLHEKTDCRNISKSLTGTTVDWITADLSFISLQKALPASLELITSGGYLIVLVKPQFQLGPKEIGKGGVVRDVALQEQALNKFSNWLEQQAGWHISHMLPSPVPGGDGNQEYLVCARYHGSTDIDIM